MVIVLWRGGGNQTLRLLQEFITKPLAIDALKIFDIVCSFHHAC